MARPKKVTAEPIVSGEINATTETEKPAEKYFTKAELDEIVAKAVAEAMAAKPTQVLQVAADVERVQFLFMAEVSDENVFTVGDGGAYGRITGKVGVFSVPKNDLSRAMDSLFRLLMDKRWIIVVSGMTDEERAAYGVAYREGEILDKNAFARMVEIEDKILDIYPKLCEGHREMVAKRYYEAYLDKNPHVRRDVVVALNNMSKELGSKHGDFDTIIEMMNEADRH